MDYRIIECPDYDAFHALLNAYYREGEDADTPQEQVDGFIQELWGMVRRGEICCRLAAAERENIGFVLWAADTEDFAFSELPGMGTVLEIGVAKPFRRLGLGSRLVECAEEDLRQSGIRRCYVSAYEPAQTFWERSGYTASGEIAANGLPLMLKRL